MRKTIAIVLLAATMAACHTNERSNQQPKTNHRDTVAVIASYQLGNSLQVQTSVADRIVVDTTMESVDSAKSTLTNIVKTKKDTVIKYYIVPFLDTLKKDGHIVLDSLGKPRMIINGYAYPESKVAELKVLK